ncbi:hypothetical protein O0I10_008399 [Lichtheimia ornata]|uniref:Uncharacterized protein n=1 Tax=Lichtheimia ornata TaxID=688661 RepID=A0AAD7UYJ7_9FUNG|nr:uncharacterized protein O0I10_008399 [Lichtheimia ornata]KAJ8655959.1 hypothetical protein O0I10_008399 [Lichtheimia ornata]
MAQRDHCREVLVFWCFGVYKITAMIAKWIMSAMRKTAFISWCRQSLFHFWWLVTKQRAISLKSVRQCKSLLSGSSRYRQFGGHPEMKVSYRLITSAARNNLYIFDISKLSISWWFWLLAIPLMDLYNHTRLMDGSCHQQAMRARVDIFGVTKVIYASPQGIHRQAAFDFQ